MGRCSVRLHELILKGRGGQDMKADASLKVAVERQLRFVCTSDATIPSNASINENEACL